MPKSKACIEIQEHGKEYFVVPYTGIANEKFGPIWTTKIIGEPPVENASKMVQ